MAREPFIRKDSMFLKVANWEGVEAGFTTRLQGASVFPYDSLNLGFHVGDEPNHVRENRRRIGERLGVLPNRWICAEQVHGSNIEKVTRNDAGKGARGLEGAIPETDGLYTREAGVLLSLGYADCVPLYFFAPEWNIVGIAHAGWRGTTSDIAGKMIEDWVEKEQIPRDAIRVVIGPSIGECCYEVDLRVINQVEMALNGNTEGVYRSTDEEHFKLDLKECNFRLCEQAGISAKQIEASLYCTSCSSDIFFSHRKENGQTGRMLGFVGLKD
ncbi:MAG TPA: peptidoglycan editing factor PgeF [Bacillales bacterium]|nr:peptidoglycan editing factor PgeF [Bacillales bacterium]